VQQHPQVIQLAIALAPANSQVMAALPERVLAFRKLDENDNPETSFQYLIKFVGISACAAKWMFRENVSNTWMIDAYHDKLTGKTKKKRTAVEDTGYAEQLAPLPVLRESTGCDKASSETDEKEGKEEKRNLVHDHEENDDGDDDWKSPSLGVAAAIAAVTTIIPYVFEPDAKLELEWLKIVPSPSAASGLRISDLIPASHAALLIDVYLAWRNQPMCVPFSSLVILHFIGCPFSISLSVAHHRFGFLFSLFSVHMQFRTSATVRLPRTRTQKASQLARSNSRYLLGTLIAMGLPRVSISLDMFAHESICRNFAMCIENRRVGAERRYQVSKPKTHLLISHHIENV
jgi:hypothetical protein